MSQCVVAIQVSWDDVGGLDELKQQLKDIAADLKVDPETADAERLLQPRGMLLYGAPGCSKTLLARAFAAEGGLNFIAVRCTDIFSKYVGESEKAVAKTFSRARQAAPAVVFFDEIDGLMRARGDAGTGTVTAHPPVHGPLHMCSNDPPLDCYGAHFMPTRNVDITICLRQ